MRPFFNLRVRFAEYEMPQNEVARSLGISESTLSARMNGKKPFDAWEMQAIAGILDIAPEEYVKYFFDFSPSSRANKAVK